MKSTRIVLLCSVVLALLAVAAADWIEATGGANVATAQQTEAKPQPAPRPVLNSEQAATGPAAAADDGKLRVIAFGAHPDDCEIRVGGTGALWARQGHHVTFVSATNGDIGHWRQAGGPLARRRLEEVRRADRLLGAATVVFDIHDGELEPTLENRRRVTRAIRAAGADIVLSHRPNDYHPDHRYTGVLVQDSAFMVAVPFWCPDAPPLAANPVFLFYYDRFQKPTPFEPDVAVSIDEVIEAKLDALAIMESQFYEGGALGSAALIPQDETGRRRRQKEVREGFRRRFRHTADEYRPLLVELYGKERGEKVQYAEAFEVCEYGRQPTRAELLKLFPFYPIAD